MTRLRHAFRRLAACTRGTTAVEFAIVSGVMITLLIGVVDFGRTLYIKNQISYLADRAVRSVLLRPDIDNATLESELRATFHAGDPQSLVVEITSDSAGGTEYRIVTINFPVALLIPNIAAQSIALRVSRRVPAG